MKQIQDALVAYLEKATGVKTVSQRTRVHREYPLLAVSVREGGTVLIDAGRQAEHTYQVTVSAVSDREREENTQLLTGLCAVLLRGVPMELPEAEGESGGRRSRVLRPLDIRTEGEELTFSLCLCVPVPQPLRPGQAAPEMMRALHVAL